MHASISLRCILLVQEAALINDLLDPFLARMAMQAIWGTKGARYINLDAYSALTPVSDACHMEAAMKICLTHFSSLKWHKGSKSWTLMHASISLRYVLHEAAIKISSIISSLKWLFKSFGEAEAKSHEL